MAAVTVAVMARIEDSNTPLADIALGDVVVLPDGRSMTARSKAVLPTPVGSMAGFVICGEMEVLLSTPSASAAPINLYVPLDYFPFEQAQARVAAEGAASYWAPHLPALRGAMGEILWRVVEVRGSVDPAVVVYRGAEVIVFIRVSFFASSSLKVLCMRRDVSNDVDATRHSSIVRAPGAPVEVPETERTLYETFTR